MGWNIFSLALSLVAVVLTVINLCHRKMGYNEGYNEGHNDGYNDGYSDAKRLFKK